MELSWLMRLRITAAMATGVILIGILAWPIVQPHQPYQVVSLITRSISFGDAIILAVLASLAGFIAYFLSWPYGREIGPLAAPSGLAIWAIRTGSMAGLLQLNPALHQRQAVFATLKWEPLFWLAIVAAGFVGVLTARRLRPTEMPDQTPQNTNTKSNICIYAIIGVVLSVLIAHFLIGRFAQDIGFFDSKLGSVVGQPAVGQIAFAVLVSFGIAAFALKTFLDISYIWPTIASALISAFVITTYTRQEILQYLIARHPAAFFCNAALSILPVQMVAFGALGSIAGYWLAIRYNFWRKPQK